MPKGVKAEMVEEQLKGMTADPAKATKEQKAEAEETVEKELRDQMVLDVLAEKLDVKVSQADVFNFLASIAQQYGMDPNAFIQAIIRNGQLRFRCAGSRPFQGPARRHARLQVRGRDRGPERLPRFAPLKTKSPRASRLLPLPPPWLTSSLPTRSETDWPPVGVVLTQHMR